MYETITTTNSKLLNNEVKGYCIELKSPVIEFPSSVKLCPGFDPINVLSWSHVNVNTSFACTLASRIAYDDEMTASSRGSDCLNAENASFDHGILTSIWTVCLRNEMKILSSCTVTACPLSAISLISLDVMKILGIWSTNCSLIMIDVCIYCLFLEI